MQFCSIVEDVVVIGLVLDLVDNAASLDAVESVGRVPKSCENCVSQICQSVSDNELVVLQLLAPLISLKLPKGMFSWRIHWPFL